MRKITIISLFALLLLSLTACGSDRTPLSANEFQSQMTAAGFEVLDITDQYPGESVEAVMLAVNDDYTVEFYIVPTEQQAITAFNQNKSAFEDQKVNPSTNSTVNLKNYNVYKQNSGGEYYVVSRTANTFVYVVTGDDNQTSVDEILTSLGY